MKVLLIVLAALMMCGVAFGACLGSGHPDFEWDVPDSVCMSYPPEFHDWLYLYANLCGGTTVCSILFRVSFDNWMCLGEEGSVVMGSGWDNKTAQMMVSEVYFGSGTDRWFDVLIWDDTGPGCPGNSNLVVLKGYVPTTGCNGQGGNDNNVNICMIEGWDCEEEEIGGVPPQDDVEVWLLDDGHPDCYGF